MQPFEVTETVGKFDVFVRSAAAAASPARPARSGTASPRHWSSPTQICGPVLRKLGYLTRDPRVKERKKAGRKRARRGFQFSKR